MTINKWQKKYCEVYYKGKVPKSKIGKYEYDLLGDVKDYVIVTYDNGKRVELEVTLDECDIPNNKINVETLASNLRFWKFNGFLVQTR